jgi:hypothetical protein
MAVTSAVVVVTSAVVATAVIVVFHRSCLGGGRLGRNGRILQIDISQIVS